MAIKEFQGKIQLPFDTEENWNASARILLYGERAYAKTKNGDVRSKTGNGYLLFRDLPFDDGGLYFDVAGKADASLSNVSDSDFLARIHKIDLEKHFDFTQSISASVWNIQHGLNKRYPRVICFNEDGDRILGDINYYSENLLTVSFSEPLRGTAHLS